MEVVAMVVVAMEEEETQATEDSVVQHQEHLVLEAMVAVVTKADTVTIRVL